MSDPAQGGAFIILSAQAVRLLLLADAGRIDLRRRGLLLPLLLSLLHQALITLTAFIEGGKARINEAVLVRRHSLLMHKLIVVHRALDAVNLVALILLADEAALLLRLVLQGAVDLYL